MTATFADFAKLDLRVGQILRAEPFPEARKPAYKLWIDFGELGIKKSSAQITHHYTCEQLRDRAIVAIVNFPPRQIANFMSEVLVLGVVQADETVILLTPDAPVAPGLKIL